MPVAELQTAHRDRAPREPRPRGGGDRGPPEEAEEEQLEETRTSAPGTSGSTSTRSWTRRSPSVPRDPNEEAVDTEEFVGSRADRSGTYLEQQLRCSICRRAVLRAAGGGRRLARRRRLLLRAARRDRRDRAVSDAHGRARRSRSCSSSIRPASGRADLAEALRHPAGVPRHRRAAAADDRRDSTSTTWPRATIRKIARALHVDEDEVRRLVEILRAAQPASGRGVLAGSVARLHRARRHDPPLRRGVGHHPELRRRAHAAREHAGTARCCASGSRADDGDRALPEGQDPLGGERSSGTSTAARTP